MVRSKLLILIIVGAIINPVPIHAEHPYTEPAYVTSETVEDIIQVPETNDDDKANLEPTPLNQARGDLGGLLDRYTAYGLGFSTKGDNDYFLFQPQLTADIESSYIRARIDTHFYTVNPQNGTWMQFSLETINGTVEIQVQVKVASDPHREILDAVVQYNHTDEWGGQAYGRNIYAIWGNNNRSVVTPQAYKNESGVIFLAPSRSNLVSFNDTSTSLSDTFSWRASKFYISVILYVDELPLQAFLNDVFFKISSPLNLTFTYDFKYDLYAKPTTARLDFPIYYFLFAFIPLALVLLRRKLKKLD